MPKKEKEKKVGPGINIADIMISVSESGIHESHGSQTNWLVIVINIVGMSEECLKLVHCDVTVM